MRAISLDVGDKTIGVALSDMLGITANGLMTIDRIGIRKDADKVLNLVKEHGCDTIVIGLPLNLDGSDSVQTQKVRKTPRSSGLSVIYSQTPAFKILAAICTSVSSGYSSNSSATFLIYSGSSTKSSAVSSGVL